MMRSLFLGLLALSSAHAALTTIQDTIYNSQLGLANCTIYATPSQSWVSAQGKVIRPDPILITVVNGVLNTKLEDNATSVPSGTSYNVTNQCGSTFSKVWVVPASGTPVGIAAIETSALVGPPSLIALSQLQGLPIAFTNTSNTFTVGTQDISTVAHTLTIKVGTFAVIPAQCTVGEVYFANDKPAGANIYGCTTTNNWTLETGGGGGGPTNFSQLNDFAATNNAASIQTLGANCAPTTPCQVRQGAVNSAQFTAPITQTVSGTPTGGVNHVFCYFTNQLILTCGHNTSTTLTCGAGCSVATGITGFPTNPGTIPLWNTTFTGTTWNAITGAMDARASMSTNDVEPGNGLTCSDDPTTGIRTCSTDPTQVPRYFKGSGNPNTASLACTQGRDFYTDTSAPASWFCSATNTWTQTGGGTAFPITPGTYYEYDNFLTNANFTGGGLLAWSMTSNAGSPTNTAETAGPTSVGGVQISTAASSSSDVSWLRGQNVFGYKNFHTGQTFQFRTSVSGVTSDGNTTYRFGLSDTTVPAASAGPPANGIYIEKAAADTQWFGVCRTASVQTRSAALATVTAGAQIAFQIAFVSVGTIAFKTASTVGGLAGASAVTVNSNCPSVAAGVSFGAETAVNVAKSLGLFFYDMYITGLGY